MRGCFIAAPGPLQHCLSCATDLQTGVQSMTSADLQDGGQAGLRVEVLGRSQRRQHILPERTARETGSLGRVHHRHEVELATLLLQVLHPLLDFVPAGAKKQSFVGPTAQHRDARQCNLKFISCRQGRRSVLGKAQMHAARHSLDTVQLVGFMLAPVA